MMRDMCKAETVHVGEQGQIGTKVEQFERLPPIFMIGLKRFHSEDGRFFKVERHIEIPHWLDVPRECLSNLALATVQGNTTTTTTTATKDKEASLGTKSYQLYAGTFSFYATISSTDSFSLWSSYTTSRQVYTGRSLHDRYLASVGPVASIRR